MKEASYTVEAVFVGCITIWVILALLYSSFYIHDRMILGSEIGNRIECGSERGELSVSEKEENNLCRLLNEKLFLMKINQVSLTKKIASVRADVRYSLPISLKCFLIRRFPVLCRWRLNGWMRKNNMCMM